MQENIVHILLILTILNLIISLIDLYYTFARIDTYSDEVEEIKKNIKNNARQQEIQNEIEELEKRFNTSDNGIAMHGLTYNLPHSTIKLEDMPSVEEVDESTNPTILEVAE